MIARDEPVTITMTAQEWDALLREPYADRGWSEANAHVKRSVPGADERRAAAQAEVEARLPVLTDAGKAKLTESMREQLRDFEAGEYRGDHLGHGDYDNSADGFRVSITPHIQGGGSAFHLEMASLWFERTQYGLTRDDRDWFVAAVAELTAQDADVLYVWNDAVADRKANQPWVSVRFR